MQINKILYICDHSMNLVGGSQESLRVVIDGIKDEYDVSLYTPGTGEYKDEKVRHIHFSHYDSMKTMIKHPIAFLRYYGNLRRLIMRNDYRVIHTQEQVGYYAVALMKRLRLIDRKILLVHTERGLLEKYNGLFKRLFIMSLKYTDGFITTTHYNHKAWSEIIYNQKHYDRVKCVLIENTAGQRFEIYDPAKRTTGQSKLNVGFAGRYCSWKGWDLVTEICRKLQPFHDVNVEIVLGCLTPSDMAEGQKLYEKIREILGDRLTWHVNYTIEQMNEFYYGIDLFCLTSDPHSESFGRVLVEAMSRHVGILGTDCGGATEVMGSQVRICHSADEFAEKINAFNVDRALLEKEKEDCYQRYCSHYSVKNNVDKHKALYQMMVSGQ